MRVQRDLDLNMRIDMANENKKQEIAIKGHDIALAHNYITHETNRVDNRHYGYQAVNNDMYVKKKTVGIASDHNMP